MKWNEEIMNETRKVLKKHEKERKKERKKSFKIRLNCCIQKKWPIGADCTAKFHYVKE